MSFGETLQSLRKKQGLTQEALGEQLHVTRQTVSNWETGKNYPDLELLVALSNLFNVSLDILLKGDGHMIRKIDQERSDGRRLRKSSWIGRCGGTGLGLLCSALISPDSWRRTAVIAAGLFLICLSQYFQFRWEHSLLHQLKGPSQI